MGVRAHREHVLAAALAVGLTWACGLPESGAQAASPAQQSMPPLTRWVAGSSLRIAPQGTYSRLRVPDDADWGNCYVEGTLDVDAFPYLAIWVAEVGRGANWQLTVNDPDVHVLERSATTTGLHVYDLREKAAWRGRKTFRVYVTVQGRGGYVDFGAAAFFSAPPPLESAAGTEMSVPRWESMNGARLTNADGNLSIVLARSQGDTWGGACAKTRVDADRFPFFEVEARDLAPQSRWRIEINHHCTGPESRDAGVLPFNYRDAANWHGSQEVEIWLIVLGSEAAIRFDNVRLRAFPSLSADLVGRSPKPTGASSQVAALLQTGDFRLSQDREVGVFRIGRTGAPANLLTRFLEVPGLNLAQAPTPTPQPLPDGGGQRFSVAGQVGDVQYTANVEASAAVPGLFHWRVTATPGRPAALPSSGQELALGSGAAGAEALLQRVTSQNLCATAQAFAVVPGVGTALYLQNLTALNPLFERCRFSPRYLVSVGPRTFGCANPANPSVIWPAGAPVTLADTWLYLSPSVPANAQEQAALFLEGLAAIYDGLPDKPETRYVDWQELARLSLRDLHRGECWGRILGKDFLRPYVTTEGGAEACMAPLQDVLAPLMRFQHDTGEGADIVARLRATVPDFWSADTGTFRAYATPGNHIAFDPSVHVNLCRAAQAGDEQARALSLRSAEAFIRFAHDTSYGFQQKDWITEDNELSGAYILYMMLCHDLSGDGRFVEEARRAAPQVEQWGFTRTREIYWTAMACEGLARLYAATNDEHYLRLSLVPLASLMRSAWLWECDFGWAKAYSTFFGLNPDASGIDYIAPMEEHQSWYSLRQYYLLARRALPNSARRLVAEFLRYAPMTIWDTYPPHLPPESYHQGKAFWNTTNVYDLYIPLEDLNDGWRRNGSVGQELYGAGAAFNLATEAYTRVSGTGILLFCEYPLLDVKWESTLRALTAHIGGVTPYGAKMEVRVGGAPAGWQKSADLAATWAPEASPGPAKPLTIAVSGEALRLTAPGESVIRITGLPPSGPPPTPVAGQPQPRRGDLVFEDLFAGDAGLNLWQGAKTPEDMAASHVVAPGVLDLTQGTYIVTKDSCPADRVVELRVRVPNAGKYDVDVLPWYAEKGEEFLQVSFTPQGCALHKFHFGFTGLASGPAPVLSADQWHTVTIQLAEGQLQVWLDGALTLTWTGDLPKDAGRMGFRGSGMEVDDVRIHTVSPPKG